MTTYEYYDSAKNTLIDVETKSVLAYLNKLPLWTTKRQSEKSHNSCLKEEKVWHIGICVMAYYKTREICPKWSGTPSTAQDFSWTHHTQLHAISRASSIVL